MANDRVHSRGRVQAGSRDDVFGGSKPRRTAARASILDDRAEDVPTRAARPQQRHRPPNRSAPRCARTASEAPRPMCRVRGRVRTVAEPHPAWVGNAVGAIGRRLVPGTLRECLDTLLDAHPADVVERESKRLSRRKHGRQLLLKERLCPPGPLACSSGSPQWSPLRVGHIQKNGHDLNTAALPPIADEAA
jgi:hypothetical protein